MSTRQQERHGSETPEAIEMPDCRLSGISGMGQWNGIIKWNTGISFNCIFVSLEYFLAL